MDETIVIPNRADFSSDSEYDAAVTKALTNDNANQNNDSTNQDYSTEDNNQTSEELLLGKFKTQEDLIKAYKELETKMSKDKEPKVTQPDVKDDLSLTKESEGTTEVQKEEKITFSKASEEYSKNKKISEETYNIFAKSGISREDVDEFILGQEAKKELAIAQVHNSVGGKQVWDSMVEWAKKSIDPTELKMYEKIIQDPSTRAVGIKTLSSLYKSANPTNPSVDHSSSSTSAANSSTKISIKTEADLLKYQSDKRYGKDSEFTNKVQEAYFKLYS